MRAWTRRSGDAWVTARTVSWCSWWTPSGMLEGRLCRQVPSCAVIAPPLLPLLPLLQENHMQLMAMHSPMLGYGQDHIASDSRLSASVWAVPGLIPAIVQRWSPSLARRLHILLGRCQAPAQKDRGEQERLGPCSPHVLNKIYWCLFSCFDATPCPTRASLLLRQERRCLLFMQLVKQPAI